MIHKVALYWLVSNSGNSSKCLCEICHYVKLLVTLRKLCVRIPINTYANGIILTPIFVTRPKAKIEYFSYLGLDITMQTIRASLDILVYYLVIKLLLAIIIDTH